MTEADRKLERGHVFLFLNAIMEQNYCVIAGKQVVGKLAAGTWVQSVAAFGT